MGTENMKVLFILIIMSLSANAYSEECSKEKAKKEVQRVCQDIKTKGKAALATENLLFDNCGKNYIWVQDTDKQLTMVMHPIKRRLNGKPLDQHKDENGVALFVEFDIEAHKVAKKNVTQGARQIASFEDNHGGWVDYLWAKPGAEKATAKTSYVELCEGPGGIAWIAGSGVWKEDLK